MKAILLFLLMLPFLCGCSDNLKKAKIDNAVAVRVIKIKTIDDVVGSNYIGIVHPEKTTQISSKYPGKLVSLKFSQGDFVKKGDVIAEIESQTVKSSYLIAEATLRQAEDGYKRLMQVKSTNSVPDIKVVEVETQLAKAKAAYQLSLQSLEECNVKAPFSGIIGEVYLSEGVELTPFDEIIKLLDVSSLEIKISVPEKEIGKMKVGDEVSYVVPALSDTCLSAIVKSKGVTASLLSHSYDCTLTLPKYPKTLMPGMVTKVYVSRKGISRIVVPASIVRFDDKGKYVWGVKDNVVYKQYVSIGDYFEKGIIVTEGLNDGDMILVDGTQKVGVGTKVKIIE